MSSDFHKIENLKFDISKLQNSLKTVLQRKSYDDAAGTKFIAGISLNFNAYFFSVPAKLLQRDFFEDSKITSSFVKQL